MRWFSRQSKPDHIYRRMGFYSDQSGVRKRYLREKELWQEHLHHTRQTILQEAAGAHKGTVAILGSGWLYDVPLNELSGLFEKVYLFDIYHPHEVRKYAEEYANVAFVQTDLTGMALPVYRWLKGKRPRPEGFNSLIPSLLPLLNDFDYVVSCNILDQLDIFLLDYIRHRMILAPQEANSISAKIQDTHLQWLPPGKSLLICDTAELWIAGDQSVYRSDNLYHSQVKLPEPLASWEWKFDHHGLYNPGFNTWFTVNSFRL